VTLLSSIFSVILTSRPQHHWTRHHTSVSKCDYRWNGTTIHHMCVFVLPTTLTTLHLDASTLGDSTLGEWCDILP
jgi:hypothetical protein